MNVSREWLDVFKGYNHNLRIGEGEFYEMKNLSSDNYPILSPRGKRGTYATPNSPQGMIAKKYFCYVDGGDIVICDKDPATRVPLGLTVDKDADDKIIPKTLISMGAYVIVMPDKKYINIEKPEDHGSVEATFTSSLPTTFTLCKVDGVAYEDVTIQATEPTDQRIWTIGSTHREKRIR